MGSILATQSSRHASSLLGIQTLLHQANLVETPMQNNDADRSGHPKNYWNIGPYVSTNGFNSASPDL
jgi:hypothetical protein